MARLDVAVTGAFILSSGSGGGYLIDGSNYASWDDTTDNLGDMAIYSSGTYAYVSQVSQEQGDIDGNGTADLVIAGTDRYRAYQGSYTEQAVSIFFDSSFSNSELDTDEANVLLYDSESSYGQSTVLSSIDFDGDGYSDVIYGDWNGQSASFNGNLSSTGRVIHVLLLGCKLKRRRCFGP